MPILAAFSWTGFWVFVIILGAITLFISFGGVEEIKEEKEDDKP